MNPAKRKALEAAGVLPAVVAKAAPGPVEPVKATQGRYAKPGDDGYSSLERDYAAVLEQRKRAGEIADWQFHSIKLLTVRGCPKTEHAAQSASTKPKGSRTTMRWGGRR